MTVRNLLAAICALTLPMAAASASAATLSWTGAVNNLWSVGGNWNGGVAPVSGDALTFPSGAANTDMVNDIAGLSLQSLDFPGGGSTSYSLTGSGFSLSAGINVACCESFNLNAPVTLTASQQFTQVANLGSVIDLNGNALTIAGTTTMSGSLIGTGNTVIAGVSGGGVNLTGTSTFSGLLILQSEGLNIAGAVSNSVFTSQVGIVSGSGTVGETHLEGGELRVGNDSGAGCCQDQHSIGILSTGSLTALIGTTMRFDIVTPVAGNGYDQVNVTGAVTLSSPTLALTLPSAIPTPGQSFTIINNDGTDPVVGTFKGLPEHSVIQVDGVNFQISYVGGSGNDVVLTAIAAGNVPTMTLASLLLLAVILALAGVVALRTM